MLRLLKELKEENIISAADYYFAQLIDNKQKNNGYEQSIADLAVFLAALCCYHQQQGHTCVKLDENLSVNPFGLGFAKEVAQENRVMWLRQLQTKLCYPVTSWQKLLASHVAFTADPLQKIAPLVFQFDALYFYRYWQDEQRVAYFFNSRLPMALPFSEETIRETLAKFFPVEHYQLLPEEQHAWQKIAVATAIKQPFCVLTGGPGTGKTTTVTRLLLALQSLYHGKLAIKLVAPTGKAAARLSESLAHSLYDLCNREQIDIADELRQSLPQEAETLHRLLGIGYFASQPKYHANYCLPLDVLIVDEASMVDLSMMATLVQALSVRTKLILLGDQDQLASVEAGAILAELGKFQQTTSKACEYLPYSQAHAEYLQRVTAESLTYALQAHPLRDKLCHLFASRRFGERKHIGALANAINAQQVETSWQCFEQDHNASEIEKISLDFPDSTTPEQQAQRAMQLVIDCACKAYHAYFSLIHRIQSQALPVAENLAEIFAAFNQVRFLTAVRKGDLGSEYLNQAIFEKLKKQGIVQYHQGRENYLGKPILITQNDRNVQLYNGDIGLYLLEKNNEGKWQGRYYFENGKTELPSRLPPHETAFAMTIHKSQGSEFEHSFVVLPLEFNPVLTKELLYTGITRAKRKVTIFCCEKIWKMAVNKATVRQSGIGERLKNGI